MSVDWSTTVFLLIAPDAIARHLAVPILDRAAAAGFTPVAYRPVPFPPADLDALYERNIRTVWDAYRFRLVDLLFSYGPMLVVLLDDTRREPGRSGHERFKELKGDSDPTKAAAGTLRRDLWAINVTMSLLHASDSEEEAEAESPFFLSGGTALPVTRDGEVASVCRLLAPGPPEERKFDDVLGGFRAKVSAAVWEDLSPAGRDLVLRCSDRGVATLARPGFGSELVDSLRGKHAHPVAGTLACDFTPETPRVDVPRMRALLRSFGVEVDSWEELVLTTSMTWAPRRVSQAED